MSKSVRLTTVAPLVSEMPPECVTSAALRSSAASPPVIGKLAVVPASVGGRDHARRDALPGDRLQHGRVDASAVVAAWRAARSPPASAVDADLAERRVPSLNAVTPNAPLSAFAAARLSLAVRPDTLVPKPERVTLGVPVRSRIVTRAAPSCADSVIFRPTLDARSS